MARLALDALDEDEDVMEIEFDKNFYYVISPDGKVVDCAKIYSFLHENNIYQRIIAKVAQDLDRRINQESQKK